MSDIVQQRRAGCCADWPKPCSYHEGYQDGHNAAADEIERLRGLVRDIAETLDKQDAWVREVLGEEQ